MTEDPTVCTSPASLQEYERQVRAMQSEIDELEGQLQQARTEIEAKDRRIETLIERRLEAEQVAGTRADKMESWHRQWWVTIPAGLAVGSVSTAVLLSR